MVSSAAVQMFEGGFLPRTQRRSAPRGRASARFGQVADVEQGSDRRKSSHTGLRTWHGAGGVSCTAMRVPVRIRVCECHWAHPCVHGCGCMCVCTCAHACACTCPMCMDVYVSVRAFARVCGIMRVCACAGGCVHMCVWVCLCTPEPGDSRWRAGLGGVLRSPCGHSAPTWPWGSHTSPS